MQKTSCYIEIVRAFFVFLTIMGTKTALKKYEYKIIMAIEAVADGKKCCPVAESIGFRSQHNGIVCSGREIFRN